MGNGWKRWAMDTGQGQPGRGREWTVLNIYRQRSESWAVRGRRNMMGNETSSFLCIVKLGVVQFNSSAAPALSLVVGLARNLSSFSPPLFLFHFLCLCLHIAHALSLLNNVLFIKEHTTNPAPPPPRALTCNNAIWSFFFPSSISSNWLLNWDYLTIQLTFPHQETIKQNCVTCRPKTQNCRRPLLVTTTWCAVGYTTQKRWGPHVVQSSCNSWMGWLSSHLFFSFPIY